MAAHAEHACDDVDAVQALHRATAIYTRDAVVEQLLDRIGWPHPEATLADTSCGNGAFLVAALRRRLALAPASPAHLIEQIRGWEIHPEAAEEARCALRAVLRDHGWRDGEAHAAAASMVVTGDFLADPMRGPKAQYVIGNPPYLRFARCPGVLRARYEHALPRWACADMLHAFLARCAERLADGGEIILVTADRWLFNTSAAALREQLGNTLRVSHVERLDASTAFHRPKARRAGTPARVHPVVVHLRPDGVGRPLTRAPLYPDAWDEAPHVGRTLGDVACIRLAPWLGPHGAFVVDHEAAATLPRELLVPAVDTDDIRHGQLMPHQRYAILTRPDTPPPPSVQDHLERHRHRLPPRARRTQPWLPAETWHHLDLSREVLLVPRIARGVSPVRVPSGTLPINHNLTIVGAGSASLDDIEAVLRSPESDRWIRARAPRLEDGFMSLSTSTLRALPWPLS